MSKSILIVEDEQVLRSSLAQLLGDEGYSVVQASDGHAALQQVVEQPFHLVITDVRMPEMDGITLLDHLKQAAPETPVIIMTAYGTVESAVGAMKSGAFDYLLKPVNFSDLLVKVQRALDFTELSRVQKVMTQQMAAGTMFHELVGPSQAMQQLFEMARKLSMVKSTVLIEGESGTGKELFARAIHYNGVTRDKPFIAVNCGAIPDSLIESELFGHRRGAFTGAIRDKTGYFEAADGGTLFLDEISTLPLAVQSSLLRVLERRVVVPVGDTKPRAVDVRIIAASNQDLEQMVAKEQFRQDLLYRLNVVRFQILPLRQRKEDIPALANHFLERFNQQMGKHVPGLANSALRTLLAHEWRGNVRELENVIERAVIFVDDRPIEARDLPFGDAQAAESETEDLHEAVRQFERQYIMASLQRHDYDKAITAKNLGVGVSSLYRKLDELNIPKNPDDPRNPDPRNPDPRNPPSAEAPEPAGEAE